MLADYAVRVEDSRGRRYPQPPHPYRNAFQRDRDRIVHARAFRRLEAKTQVFTRRYSDHFRNRLTHTLEVSQIARTIGAQLGLNVDLVEALALVHDIGHPPFGHAGEKALNVEMQKHGLFFDHNLHALRIVEDFEMRYAAFRGLNLTFEVREGIIKHSRRYDPTEFPQLAGYLLDQNPPLEAQLIDIADELAYITADLDDGYEAHLLSFDQIVASVPVFSKLFAEVEKLYPNAEEKLQFNEVLRRLLDRFAGDLIRTTRHALESSDVHSLDDIRRGPGLLPQLSPEVDTERSALKEFLHQNVYFSETLAIEKVEAERVIGELFALFMASPQLLPASYQEKSHEEPLPRIICDYIAGMTDHYIFQQHDRHVGERLPAGARPSV
jgi:dGTPase